MIIQTANISDAPSIANFQVLMAMESEGTSIEYSQVLKGVSEAITDPNKGTYIIARSDENEPIASLFVTREWSDWHGVWYWWIQSVYVNPAFRRQGVYKAMYNHVKSMAKDSNVTTIRLYVDKTNATGLSTYRSIGMHESHYVIYEEELF